MAENRITGSLVALATPFASDGSLDLDAFARLCDWQIEQGTEGLIVCGTTGEAATLKESEYLEVVGACVRAAKGRVPVIAGTGSNSTAVVLERHQRVSDLGVDAALVVAPYYNKPTQGGLLRHYETLLEGSELPIVLYNVPGRTASNIAAPTTLALAAHPRCLAVKEASGDLSQIQTIIFEAPRHFTVLSGDDGLAFSLMALGGHGNIGVAPNVAPALMRQLCDAVRTGDLEAGRRVQARVTPLIDAIFAESNPIPLKAAMARMGLCENVLRLPLVAASAETEALLDRVLGDLEIV